eukprot:477738_1
MSTTFAFLCIIVINNTLTMSLRPQDAIGLVDAYMPRQPTIITRHAHLSYWKGYEEDWLQQNERILKVEHHLNYIVEDDEKSKNKSGKYSTVNCGWSVLFSVYLAKSENVDWKEVGFLPQYALNKTKGEILLPPLDDDDKAKVGWC